MKINPITLFFLIFFFLFFTEGVFATEVDWPTSPLTGESLGKDSEFHNFIRYLYGWAIGIGGLLTFVMIVWGGLEWMLSAGNPGKVVDARNRIQSAVLGLALLLSTFLILNTINPQLTRLAPLPPLWDDMMLTGVEIDSSSLNEPPCEFAILKTEGGGDFRIDVGQHYEGENARAQYASGKGFRRLTEEEKELFGEMEETDVIDGREIRGDYIEGSSCLATFYHSSGILWGYDPCADIAGAVPLPNEDLAKSMNLFEEEKELSCLKLQNVGRGSQ